VDVNLIRRSLLEKGAFYVDEILVEVVDEVMEREVDFPASLSDIGMLEKWVKDVRKLEKQLAEPTIEEGKIILTV
jgi:Cft2 family RNA processing exonuclease